MKARVVMAVVEIVAVAVMLMVAVVLLVALMGEDNGII
jgi:hypothetical protein